jgi:glutaminyl-peptide cyclotransferase
MTPRVSAALSCAAALCATSCGPAATAPAPPPPDPAVSPNALSGARALEEAAALVAIGPRESGSAGAARAAEHLRARLSALGWAPAADEFQDDTPAGRLTFRNVLAEAGPRDRPRIVLLSHYDTAPGLGPAFVGANDSGSSSGLLLELARVLTPHPPAGAAVLLGFLDGEESRTGYRAGDGLHGSRRLAARLRAEGRVAAVIVLDMVGDRDLSVTLPRNGDPRLTRLALDCARAEGVRDRFSLLGRDVLDDHVPFLEAGMPAVDLIDFQFGSAPGRNDYWHTPADTLDKLSAESLQVVGRVVLRMIGELAGAR